MLLHEFGHALGLEHPFEAADGDTVNGSTNPWTSAFPEETVMAYRFPLSGEWPEFFTDNDLQALVQIWGLNRSRLVCLVTLPCRRRDPLRLAPMH